MQACAGILCSRAEILLFMKAIFLLYSIFCFADLSAQVTYDPNVAKQYDSVYHKLAPIFQKVAEGAEKDAGQTGSIIISVALIDDTLNLADLKPKDNSIKLYDTTGKLAEDVDETRQSLFPMIILNSLKSDTLNIEVVPWIMSEQTIRHKIFARSVTTTYEEYYKEDNILRDNESAKITNDLIVPATTVRFVLNDNKFEVGKTIYGQADVITKDFLFEAAPNFKYHILKHRFHLKYYFKIKLVKS